LIASESRFIQSPLESNLAPRLNIYSDASHTEIGRFSPLQSDL
jgi:hypothetical protein